MILFPFYKFEVLRNSIKGSTKELLFYPLYLVFRSQIIGFGSSIIWIIPDTPDTDLGGGVGVSAT